MISLMVWTDFQRKLAAVIHKIFRKIKMVKSDIMKRKDIIFSLKALQHAHKLRQDQLSDGVIFFFVRFE